MLAKILYVLFVISAFTFSANSQNQIPLDLKRERGIEMLDVVKRELKKNYYDSTFHGIDIEASYKKAKEDIKKAQRSGQVNAIISAFLMDLDDSHTFFLPDEKIGYVEYGFELQMIGNTCYVISVTKGSDAEQKGLSVGDVVYSFETFQVTRESLWKINYFYKTLSPQEMVRLVIQKPANLVEMQIKAKLIKWEDYEKKIEELKRKKEKQRELFKPFVCRDLGADVEICKLKTFDVSEGDIDKLMKNVVTKQTFILDLRRNGGGLVDTLKYFLRYFFNKDVKIATEKKRSESREVWVKANGEKKFGGRVLLLVDSRSASASEVFARVMQLEKRGVVFGDRTAGAVMESVRFVQSLVPRAVGGLGDFIPYGASITIADLEMTDGNSLEKTGLIPDQVVLKRRADFLSGSDPVLSSALSSIGLTVSPLDAGKIFPPDVDLEFE